VTLQYEDHNQALISKSFWPDEKSEAEWCDLIDTAKRITEKTKMMDPLNEYLEKGFPDDYSKEMGLIIGRI